MEFVDLSRYVKVRGISKIPPFTVLRKMPKLVLTQNLELFQDKDNVNYAESLVRDGVTVCPVRRLPQTPSYESREEFPRRILIEMTSNCNYLCRMCPQQKFTRPRMDMAGDAYRGVIDEIDRHGVEGLWMYHIGESLLHPEFGKNIQHIGSKKHLGAIWMSTNGRLFTEPFINMVLESKINYINFSAHAVSEKTYDTVAPAGNFKYVQENLESLYRLKGVSKIPKKPYLHVQMIEQETTKHEVDDFIRAHYSRAEIVSINMLEFVNLPNNTFGEQQRERKKLTTCLRVSRNDCFIFSNGDVTLCDAAFNGEILLGNVHRSSLYDIWNGAVRQNILKLNKEGRMWDMEFCRTCSDYDI